MCYMHGIEENKQENRKKQVNTSIRTSTLRKISLNLYSINYTIIIVKGALVRKEQRKDSEKFTSPMSLLVSVQLLEAHLK